jgi:hypothetical protein
VCVPITAVTRPSSQRASATFSLVASAWKSTITTGAARALLDSVVDDLERPEGRRGRASPCRFTTATGVPSVAGATASARPGEPSATFAGRITRSEAARYAPISSRAQTWLPRVTTSAPGGEQPSRASG